MDNYYKILDVDTKASKEEIKSAYNKLIKIHHPDKNGDSAPSNFTTTLLNEIHQVLSDDEKRKKYDLEHGVIERAPEVKIVEKAVYIDRLTNPLDNWLKAFGAIAAIFVLVFFVSFLFGAKE